jgi:transmembrane sensor
MERIETNNEKLLKYFRGEYSDEDATYVENVFCDNDREKELTHPLFRQFYELLDEDELENKDLDHILYKIHYDINNTVAAQRGRKITGFLNRAALIAGIIIMPLAVFWGTKGYITRNTIKETWVEIKAPAWTRTQFSLPDGTTGWLNSNSSVKYYGNFNVDRKIILKGEAFFDVSADKSRPFLVNTNEIVVKALGTRFNIASYDNENNVEVVLEEGKLQFNNKEMNKSHTMNSNDLVIYNKTLKNISTEVVDPKKYISWTEGKLIFRNDPLDVIARRLERWYDIDIKINGSLHEDFRLRATFIDEDLEEVLGLLKRSLPIEYKIEDRDNKHSETYTKKKVIITTKTT